MTLDQLLSAPLPPLDALRELWLVFPAELTELLDQAQDGMTRHRATPITFADGRAALSADILTETQEGKIFAKVFASLNFQSRGQIEVTTLQQSDFPRSPEEEV